MDRAAGVEELRIPGEEGFVVDRKTVPLRGLCPPCSGADGGPTAGGSSV